VTQVGHEQQVLLAGEQVVDRGELAGDPMAARTASGSRATSWPAICTWPPSAPIRVDRMWMVVVLPAPLGPSRAKIVPSGTSRSMPSSTTCLPKDLRSPVAAIAARDPMVAILPRLVRVALVATITTSVRPAGFRAVSPWFQAAAATVGRRRGRRIQSAVQ
jgi:hypothetical protein